MQALMVPLLAVLATACEHASPRAEADGGAPADVGSRDGGGEDATPEGPDAGLEEVGSCVLDDYDRVRPSTCPEGTPWVSALRGRLTSADGAPVANGLAQVCVRVAVTGTLVCLRPARSCEDGAFALRVPGPARCMDRAALRSFVANGPFVTSYCHLELPVADPLADLLEPTTLYPATPPNSLPPEGDPNEVRTVSFAGGLEVEVTPSELFEDYAKLASYRHPSGAPNPCFLPPGEVLDGLYGFTPEADIPGPGFLVRIPNDRNLAPGTVVDLFVLGGLSCEITDGELVEEAEWTRSGTATVSADGQTIEGGRLPCFNWFGYKARAL